MITPATINLSAPRQPRPEELPQLLALLEACALPFADLEARHLPGFLICRDDAGLVAAAGLERCADELLLRSLAVAPGYRRRGLAGQLVDALEQSARARQQPRLFLLTTTAEDFFAARGYRSLARAAAPPAIADCREFRDLCPASAVCMVKLLNGEAVP